MCFMLEICRDEIDGMGSDHLQIKDAEKVIHTCMHTWSDDDRYENRACWLLQTDSFYMTMNVSKKANP